MISLGAALVVAQFMTTIDPKAVRAFDEYLRGVDAAMTARAKSPEPLASKPAGVFSNQEGKEISRALVHDWTAITFIPGVRLANAAAMLEDFTRHASVFPEVVEGRIDRKAANQVIGFHRLRKKKVLEVNLEVRYQLDVLPSRANRYANRSKAIEIVEVEDAGTRKERRLSPGHDHGYMWGLQTYWTLEETKEGLWLEVRSITLSRDVPMGLGWAVKPLVKDLPRESLELLMDATKRFLLAKG